MLGKMSREELETELARLSQNIDVEHRKARHASDLHDKQPHIDKVAELTKQEQELRKKLEELEEKEAYTEITETIIATLPFIRAECNGRPMKVNPKNLDCEYSYDCTHKVKTRLPELLRGFDYVGNANVPKSNQWLLDQWQRVLSGEYDFTQTKECRKCRERTTIYDRHSKHFGLARILIRRMR
jgi:hypothetical protein